MGEEDAIDQNFGKNLKRHREALGISKADLLRRLEAVGWTSPHQTTITRIEEGQRSPRLGEAQLIARVLGLPLSTLMEDPVSSSLYEAVRDQYYVVFEAAVAAGQASEALEDERKKLVDLVDQMDRDTMSRFSEDELHMVLRWAGRAEA